MAGLFARVADILAADEAENGAGQRITLWPECLPAWRHWQAVQSQWRTGMGGASGLDYAGVRAYFDECGIAGAERAELFACIRACEEESLVTWARLRGNGETE